MKDSGVFVYSGWIPLNSLQNRELDSVDPSCIRNLI